MNEYANLQSKSIGIIGFGSQGMAQAYNLRDSGIDFKLGLRPGNSFELASLEGFKVDTLEKVVQNSEIIVLLTPENSHKYLITEVINPLLKANGILIFAHGFTIRFQVVPIREDIIKILVAPKAIGPQLRNNYVNKEPIYALTSAPENYLPIANEYAKAIGCNESTIFHSSFAEEAETDLFGEQAVLCGGIPALAIAAFETLIRNGYSKEAAYFECVYEIKLIADMMVEFGIAGMFNRISDTAMFGAINAAPSVVTHEVKMNLELMLQKIKDGSFAAEFENEQMNHFESVTKWKDQLENHPIAKIKLP